MRDVCDLSTTTVAYDPQWLWVTVQDRWHTSTHQLQHRVDSLQPTHKVATF